MPGAAGIGNTSHAHQVNNGLHHEAITYFGDMLRKQPELIAALLGRGTALALIGQYQAAEADFTKTILLQPKLADGYKRRSQVLGALGKSVEAIADLTMAISIEPKCSDSYFQRSVFYVRRSLRPASGTCGELLWMWILGDCRAR